MSDLLAKLINLSYELFGVVLPGFVVSLFLLSVWIATGEAIEKIAFGTLPVFSVHELKGFLDALSVISGLSVIIPLLAIWYFLGNILLWLVRGGKRLNDSECGDLRRLGLTLTMRIPKPKDSYEASLEPLFVKAYDAFKLPNEGSRKWRVFYPVAKCYLARRLPGSLVSTYQNKYTFHRSVAAAGSALFWLTIVSLLGSLVGWIMGGPPAHWPMLAVLLAGSVAIAWGFSGSYMYHWQVFGNTIITETYALINGPDYVADHKPEATGH